MTAPPHCETPPRDKLGPISGGRVEEVKAGSPDCRRKCGCLRTSEKLKQILGTFPVPPPPMSQSGCKFDKASGYNYGRTEKQYNMAMTPEKQYNMAMTLDTGTGAKKLSERIVSKQERAKTWRIVGELVSLVQLTVTATALALYYLIYCYMQLVYYTLRSALFFHNADGPMKITIGVVTVTSLIVGFNILMRMEKLIAIVY